MHNALQFEILVGVNVPDVMDIRHGIAPPVNTRTKWYLTREEEREQQRQLRKAARPCG